MEQPATGRLFLEWLYIALRRDAVPLQKDTPTLIDSQNEIVYNQDTFSTNVLIVAVSIPFQELQQSRLHQLSEDERQCRSYLTLATEVMNFFHLLTQEVGDLI